MSTDPTAPPDATLPDPALQARMAELLAPLQGHLQALAALLGNAAAAFGGPPAGPIAGTVILDPAILVAPDPLPLLKRPDPAPDAQPIATELRPADLVRDIAALPGPALGMAAASPAPFAPDPFAPDPFAPAAPWFPGPDRQGDAGEGSNAC